jgi:threonine/homoserine/homoserine lactone efflux protein
MSELGIFLGVCFLLAMVPGPGAMIILRQASRDTRRAAFITLMGNETALFAWGVAAACGLTALVAASQVAYDTIRFTGAALLLILGVQALVRPKGAQPAAEGQSAGPRSGSAWQSYSAGLFTNFMNPKAGVFAMSFLPQFLPPGLPHFWGFVLLAGGWALMDMLWFTGVIWGIGKTRTLLTSPRVWRRISQASGLAMIGLGIRAAMDG